MRTPRTGRTARVLVAQLVKHMAGWSVVPNGESDRDSYAELVREDGATIRINAGGYRMQDRVAFRGIWPRFRDGTYYSGGAYESITCAADRDAKQIALAIQRRLLPNYDVSYAKARAFVDSHDAHAEEAELTAKRIASKLGATVGENRSRRGDGVPIHNEPESVRRLVVQPAYGYGDPIYSRGMTVNFEVHGLDPETAAEVLSIIKASEQPRIATTVRVAEDEQAASEEPCPESVQRSMRSTRSA